MSARSRALIPLSAEQQAAMQAVAVTEQRRRQGRTLSAWPYASAFFRCLNGSRRISLTDLRFFTPALTKEEFHGNRLLWLAAVDKLIESFGEVCVLPDRSPRCCRATATEVASTREPGIFRLISSYYVLQLVRDHPLLKCTYLYRCTTTGLTGFKNQPPEWFLLPEKPVK